MAKRPKKKYPKIGRRTAKSDFEYTTYKDAESRESISKVEYESEKFNYVIHSTYTPDLIILTTGGKKIYVEIKGAGRSFDSANQSKLRAIKEQYPDMDLRILFYRDATLRKGSSFKQSNWAEKYGFTYAIGQLPEEWFI